jgi:hypothetical protein
LKLNKGKGESRNKTWKNYEKNEILLWNKTETKFWCFLFRETSKILWKNFLFLFVSWLAKQKKTMQNGNPIPYCLSISHKFALFFYVPLASFSIIFFSNLTKLPKCLAKSFSYMLKNIPPIAYLFLPFLPLLCNYHKSDWVPPCYTIDILWVYCDYKSSTCDVMHCRQRRHLYYGGQI